MSCSAGFPAWFIVIDMNTTDEVLVVIISFDRLKLIKHAAKCSLNLMCSTLLWWSTLTVHRTPAHVLPPPKPCAHQVTTQPGFNFRHMLQHLSLEEGRKTQFGSFYCTIVWPLCNLMPHPSLCLWMFDLTHRRSVHHGTFFSLEFAFVVNISQSIFDIFRYVDRDLRSSKIRLHQTPIKDKTGFLLDLEIFFPPKRWYA